MNAIDKTRFKMAYSKYLGIDIMEIIKKMANFARIFLIWKKRYDI